ncbi:MAG TPA: hypothetical protein PLH23_18845 [Hyphomonadaceae bacterium]|jgi:hypothetical protein|nr:hypothetical protein [Hyphomonadaceae bacterium]
MSRNARSTTLNQPDLFSFSGNVAVEQVVAPVYDRPKLNTTRQATQSHPEAAKADRLSGSSLGQRLGAVGQPPPAVTVRQSQLVAPARPRHPEPPARMFTVEDMPSYPPDLIVAAKRSMKEISTDRVLLTYKEIDGFFGISRATVARRLKDGLVPGIRIRHGRVLEDGPVRRLDRTQVLYLLLAVRARR